MKNIIKGIIIFLLLPGAVFSKEWIPERTKTEAETELGWLVAPMPVNVEGIGFTVPIAGVFSNFYKTTDLLLVAPFIKGDIESKLLSIYKLPLYQDSLFFTFNYYELLTGFRNYDRGIDSEENDYYQTLEKTDSTTFRLQTQLWDQRFEFQLGYSYGKADIQKIYDADGNYFSNIQSPERNWIDNIIGTQIDLTDNHFDPHQGFRLGLLHSSTNYGPELLSDYAVNDLNASFYFPFFKNDTLLFNYFQSQSVVTSSGTIDQTILGQKLGLGCDLENKQKLCETAENRRLQYWLERNKQGKASALGGLNRLRAYSYNRFFAKNSVNYTLEYRLNFSEKTTPINWIFLGGVKTVLQTAFFYEAGGVSDDISKLNQNLRPSYGLGFRAIISSLIYRFDLAVGDDGFAPTIFINYPLSLGSLGS